jgi:hypothetical protein
VGACLSAVLALGLQATAEDTELDTGPRVVPLAGVVDLDGVPYEGQADFEVTLIDGDQNTWTETHTGVPVDAGRYELAIGTASQETLPDWVYQVDQVYARLAVRQHEGDAWVALAGELRLAVSPLAYWSAGGGDFDVDGTLTVGQDVSVTGHTVMPNATGLVHSGDLGLASGAGAVNLGQGARVYLSDLDSAYLEFGQAQGVTLAGEGFKMVHGDQEFVVDADATSVPGSLTVNRLEIGGDFTSAYPNSSAGLITAESTTYAHTAGDGVNEINMGTTTRRACFLTRIGREDEEPADEGRRACHIFERGGDFILSTTSYYDDTDTDVSCDARCINW